MSIMTVDLIMERINVATPDSPIAVFKCDVLGQLDSVFASTVATQRCIREGSRPLVGVYHNGMDLSLLPGFLAEIAG